MRCRQSIVTEGARVLSAQMCHRVLLWTCTSHLAMGDGFSQPEHRIHNKLLQYRNSFKKHLVSEPTSEIQFPSLFSILGMKCSDAALQQHQTRTPLVSTELSITAGNAPLLWKGMLPVWEQYALGQGQPSAAWLSKDESTNLLIVFFPHYLSSFFLSQRDNTAWCGRKMRSTEVNFTALYLWRKF